MRRFLPFGAALGVALFWGGPRETIVEAAPLKTTAGAAKAHQERVVGPQANESAHAEGTRVTSTEMLTALLTDPQGPAVISMAPGIYRGNVEIRRSVALYGTTGVTFEGEGSGSVISVKADGVTLDGFNVRHSGHRHTTEDAGIKATGSHVHIAHVFLTDTLFGVSLEQCKACVVEESYVLGYGDDTELRGDGVKLWESDDSQVKNCLLEHTRDIVVWYTKRALLEGNTVHHGRYGTHFMYAHDAIVRGSHLSGNVVGIFVMYSKRLTIEGSLLAGAHGAAGVGLGFKDSDAITVRGNWILSNTTGTYLDNTPRTREEPVLFESNVFALNDVAMRLHSGDAGLAFVRNDFNQNQVLAEVDGGGNALALDVRDNHFSDYQGYDLNEDGTGDVAYEVKSLSSDLTDSHPALKYFRGTAALGVIDAVAHAMPLLSARVLFRDKAPAVGAFPSLPVPASLRAPGNVAGEETVR